MSNIMSTFLLLGAEFGLILVIFFIGITIVFFRRRNADKRYVADFISNHKKTQVERRNEIKASMQEDSLLAENQVEELLDNMNASERNLYKKILNMYLGFDRKCFSEIREELLAINNTWITAMRQSIKHAAETQLQEGGEVSSENVNELNEKIDTLTTDNLKIAGELAEAMTTMEDIVKEYSLMYAGQENPTMDRLSKDYDKLKKKSDSYNEDKD